MNDWQEYRMIRYGALETWKQRIRRCEKQVRARSKKARKKVNEFAVCRAAVPKFKGKRRRILRGRRR